MDHPIPGTPSISVVIPCFNNSEYLSESVDSVLQQTRADFEIIIVNHGSTDPGTTDLLNNLQVPRTRVLATSNRGSGAARNTGIGMALGRYVCALDPDGTLAPRYFEKTGAVLDGDPSVSFVGCWLETVSHERRSWKPDRCDLVTLLDVRTIATPALVRKDALLAAGGYDEEHCTTEDWGTWIRLVELGHHGIILPEVLAYCRRTVNSFTPFRTDLETHLQNLRVVIGEHQRAYKTHVVDVLLSKNARVSEVLRRCQAIQQDLDHIESLIALKQKELETLRARRSPQPASSAGSQNQTAAVEAALQAADRALAEIRGSLTWRATAPLRWLFDAVRGRRRSTGNARREP